MKSKERLAMLKCRVSETGTLNDYKYVVVCSNLEGKWVLSKHKQRDTWETQGGHIEIGEDPHATAKRELFEESGIKEAKLYPVCDYCGYDDYGFANGVVFLAVVDSIGSLPDSEMQEISTFDELPENLTYPLTTPILIGKASELLKTLF